MPNTSSSTTMDKLSFYHLKLLQIIGFFPLSLQPEFKPSPSPTVWSLLLISGQLLKAYLLYRYNDVFIFQEDNVGKIHDVLKFASVNLTYIVILIESLIRRNKLRGFFKNLQTLHNKYPIKYRKSNRGLWQQYAFFLYLIVVEINLVYVNADDRPLVQMWALHSVSAIPVLLHYFESVVILEFIRWELVKLNKSLSDLIAFDIFKNESKCNGMFGAYLRKRIITAQHRYQIIYQMVQESNEFFRHSWAINTLNMLIVCETYIYWIYWGYYFTIFRATFELIPVATFYVIAPTLFILRAQDCMNEAKTSAFLVHKLQQDSKDSDLSMKVKNFSLQLFHEKVAFNAAGLFPMDTNLLKSMAYSITVFTVLFIQVIPNYRYYRDANGIIIRLIQNELTH